MLDSLQELGDLKVSSNQSHSMILWNKLLLDHENEDTQLRNYKIFLLQLYPTYNLSSTQAITKLLNSFNFQRND